MELDERCVKCSGCPSSRYAPCSRNDSIAHPIAIVVEHPTALEQARQRLLLGDSGLVVRKILEHHGIRVSDIYLTTALNCRPNMKKDAMVKNAMLGCKSRLVRELKEAGVQKVLCMGSVPFSQLADAEKPLPITKHRGRWESFHGLDVIGTFSPGWLFGEADYFRDFVDDLTKFITTDPEPQPDVEMWYPQTVKEMWKAFEELRGASFVSSDVETTGLSIYSDEILAVGFGVLYDSSNDGLSVVLRQDILEAKDTWWEIAKWLSREDQASVYHNSIFDLKFKKRELDKLGLPFAPKKVEDTMLLHYCLDERPMGRFQSHKLDTLARTRCDAPPYDIGMGKWLKEYLSESTTEARRSEMRVDMHVYLALDCYYTARLYPPLLEEVIEEGQDLFSLYNNVLMPGAMTLMEIQMNGAHIDRNFFETQWESLQDRAAPILERIKEATGDDEFNPNSWQQVGKYLYGSEEEGGLGLPVYKTARRGKLKEGKTSKQVLKILKKKHPEHTDLINDILEYRNLIKNAGTYVQGILKRADGDDRIRCDFLPHGTATGRLSSANPNLQNIPESSHTGIEIRNGYTATEGYLLGEADYSQLELRVAAWLSGDENFQRVYIEDRDVHQEVAFAFFQKPVEKVTKYERYMAKCMNFGVVYGRGAHSLAFGPEMDYVEDELGGTRWSLEEVDGFFKKFFDNFPRFREWMDEQTALSYRDQQVICPFGNRRRFPFIPRSDNGAVGRQGVNTPIQGTASHLTFTALVRIHARFNELNESEGKLVARIVLTVHDSIMFEFLPAYYEIIREIVFYEMEENIPFDLPLPMKADLDVAPRWGEMGKWKIDREDDHFQLVWTHDAQEIPNFIPVEAEEAAS